MKVTGSALRAKPDGQHWGEPGLYHYDGRKWSWKPSGVPCPYCRGDLRHYDVSGVKRIAHVLKKTKDYADTIAHDLPRTHAVLGCTFCQQWFTALTSRLKLETVKPRSPRKART